MSSVKGCSNGECAAHKNKTLFKASMSYCPQCGAELIVVCKSRDNARILAHFRIPALT